jgi:outer membrane autotransporter protein
VVGDGATGVGTVTVSGTDGSGNASTWTSSDQVTIGNSGNGTLLIDIGGTASTAMAIIGHNNGTVGNVTVSGVGGGRVSTWHVDSELDVGDSGTGNMTVLGGGMVSNGGESYVGGAATGVGIVTVSGSDGAGNVSTWVSSSEMRIGYDGNGTVHVDNGGMVHSDSSIVLGYNSGAIGAVATGLVTVSGHDAFGHASTLTTSATLYVGNGIFGSGTGTLQVSDGGVVRSGDGTIGDNVGGNGQATITGAGSTWGVTGNLWVGNQGVGDLQVLDGGMVSVGTGTADIYIGAVVGSSGTVTVSSSTAATSTLSVTGELRVGYVGSGVMTIGKGGLVSVGGNVRLADFGTGTLHLNGDATGRGVLEAGSVIQGAGAATLDLNGGILRATRNESDFLSGFTALTVGTEGAWFDSNAHDIAVATDFTGTSTFNKLGLGTLTLTGNSSTFIGNTEIQAGTLQVDGVLGGQTDVLAGGRLSGTGQVGPTTNFGVIAPGHGNSFGTLTIAGNYTPSGGGLEIKTQLGDDSSPTDHLAITGSTSGVTPVTLINVGGLGAQTQQGIQVVQVNGASNGQFNLANGNYVIGGQSALIAGAYGYVLQKDAADGDWYLRSSLLAAGAPVPPGGAGGAADGPLYQPGVPVYEAYANTLMSLSGVSTLRQRGGDRRYDATDVDRSGVWGRIEGKTSHFEPSVSTTGMHQNIDSWQAQFGVDRILSGEKDGARVVGGVTASYGTADTRVSSVYGDGDIDTKAYGVGTALTWYGEQGAYVDAQAKATWFRSDLSSRLAGSLANGQNGHGYALSIEAGKAFPVREGYSLIPQAQLSYVSSSFGDFTDQFGAQVGSDKGESLQGRLGLALDYQRNWRDAAGKASRLNFYGLINLRREFLDGTRVMVAGTPIDSRPGRTWGGVGVGGDYGWGDNYAIYGEVTADSDLNGSYSVSATAGFRMMF